MTKIYAISHSPYTIKLPSSARRVPFKPDLLARQIDLPKSLSQKLMRFKDGQRIWKMEDEPWIEEAPAFSLRAMEVLQDILLYPGHRVECYLLEDWPVFYKVWPVSPDCGEPFPTYQTIAEQLEPGLHYFKKFANSEYRLATQEFVDRVKSEKLKGFTFMLRWDGKKVYPTP